MWRHLVLSPRGAARRCSAPRSSGQSLVEYAVIILLIAIAVFGALTLFGDAMSSAYGRVTSTFIVINNP